MCVNIFYCFQSWATVELGRLLSFPAFFGDRGSTAAGAWVGAFAAKIEALRLRTSGRWVDHRRNLAARKSRSRLTRIHRVIHTVAIETVKMFNGSQ